MSIFGRTLHAPRRVDVCAIRHGYFPFDSRLRRQVDALCSAGYTVHVICLRQPGERARETLGGCRVFRLPLSHQRSDRFRYVFEYAVSFVLTGIVLAGLFSVYRYRCVQSSTLPDGLVFAALLPRIFGAKVLLDVREPFPELWSSKYGETASLFYRLLVRTEQAALRFADAVLAVTPELRRRLGERGADISKIRVTSNTCNDDVLAASSLQENGASNRRNGFVLMTHGLIEPRCGHDVVIRSSGMLRGRIPGLRYVVHGFGSHKAVLEALVRDNDCEDLVVFSETCSFDRLVGMLQQIDVGIVPMQRSAYAELIDTNKMYEFIALRKPVIASRLAPVEANFDDSCIHFFTPGDADELAACILQIYKNPERARAMAERAAARLQAIGWRRHRHTYLETISELRGCPRTVS